jgi:hypothetical protein
LALKNFQEFCDRSHIRNVANCHLPNGKIKLLISEVIRQQNTKLVKKIPFSKLFQISKLLHEKTFNTSVLIFPWSLSTIKVNDTFWNRWFNRRDSYINMWIFEGGKNSKGDLTPFYAWHHRPMSVDHKAYLYAVNYGIGIRNIINLINSLMSIRLAAFAKLIIIQSNGKKYSVSAVSSFIADMIFK